MPELTEFLLERIADDEAAAIHAQAQWEGPPEQWEVRHGTDKDTLRRVGDHLTITASELGRLIRGADHIARWDPARVLAECEAKRQIVDAYVDERSRRDVYQSDESRAVEDEDQALRRRTSAARCRGLEMAVELLSRPYADHADYRDEWRP